MYRPFDPKPFQGPPFTKIEPPTERGPNPDTTLRDALERGKREPVMVKLGDPKPPADVIDPGKVVKP